MFPLTEKKCRARFVCLYLSDAATKVENIKQVCIIVTFGNSVNLNIL